MHLRINSKIFLIRLSSVVAGAYVYLPTEKSTGKSAMKKVTIFLFPAPSSNPKDM
jgi:hypothetical protein